MANTDWPDLKFIELLNLYLYFYLLNLLFAQYCTTIFCNFAKRFGNFHNQRRVVIYDLKNMADYQE